MRVAINAVAVDGGGGQTYLQNILRALCQISTAHEYLVILTTRHRHILPFLPREAQVLVCRGVPRQAGLRMAWEQTILPILLRRKRVDVLFAAYNTAVLFSPAPVVLLSHNLDPYVCLPISRGTYARARNIILRCLGRLSVRVARAVVFVSDTSARVMACRIGVEPDRVRVVHHGWSAVHDSEVQGSRPVPDLPERFILTVTDLYPHKNLEVLMEAFQCLVANRGYSGDLVIVGAERKQASDYARHLYEFRDRLPCRDRIHFMGTIAHPGLFAAYRRAELFVFPSLAETFGLPLVEAMGSGVPVIASDWRLSPEGENGQFNVGPEICGEAAEFFDPTDSASLANAVDRVLGNRERHDELVQFGLNRAQGFSWENSARQLLRILEDVGAQRRREHSATF